MSGKKHTVETLCERISVSVPPFAWRVNNAPRIHCADGFSISVQAGRGLYSTPREDVGFWSAVELGFPSSPIPEFVQYRDGDGPDEETVFAYVPIEKVVEFLNSHGGEEQVVDLVDAHGGEERS